MKDRSFEMVVPSGIENRSSLETLLPFDITINILKRLPVKTLTRFKCVAKDWLKLIESPPFIAQHLSHSASNNTFLLRPSSIPPYLLIGPDLQVHSLQFMDFTGNVIASCNGLLCVKHINGNDLFLCNPATGQIKQVPKTLIDFHMFCQIGFGFSDVVNDYKILRISARRRDYDYTIGSAVVQFDRAEVYSLSTGYWKEINIFHLHHMCPGYTNPVAANGAIFCQVSLNSKAAFDPTHYLILSFDIAQEVFTVFEGPPQSQPHHTYRLFIDILAVHDDKLAIFRRFNVPGKISISRSIDVWVLEDTCTVRQNWVKKYSVGPFQRLLNPVCFWRDGIVCLESPNGHIDLDSRVRTFVSLINPYSNELKSLPVRRPPCGLFKYAESLVAVGNIDPDQ